MFPLLTHPLSPKRSGQGSALIISLVFIILLTIVLVGFVTTAGMERKTVQSHYAKVQADLYNSMAVGVVASRISLATSGTISVPASGTNSWWISQPGRIAYTPFTKTPTTTFVDLSSGQADSVVPDVSVELNPASLTQSTGVIAYDPAISLPVKWMYVLKNGTQVSGSSAPPPYSSGDTAVVGRYAFWTDDESSRINVNTAASSKTPDTEVASHPSKIDLTAMSPLTTSDIQKIREARDKRPFNSLEEVKAVDSAATIASAVDQNKLALTYYNHSPELNRFGEPRIVLTTKKNRLTASQLALATSDTSRMIFFDILKNDNDDPGIFENIDKDKVERLFDQLFPYFNKTAADWGLPGPVTFNKTLAGKYGTQTDNSFVGAPPVGTPPLSVGAAQIILNLIDYVRSVETAQPLVLSLRGAYPAYNYFDPKGKKLNFDFNDPASTGRNGSFMGSGILGNSRRIHIVEMGVWLSGSPVTSAKVKFKVFLPASAGAPASLAGLLVQYDFASTTLNFSKTSYVITVADIAEGDANIAPGQYRTITINVPISPPGTRPTAPGFLRIAIKNSANKYSYDIAPLIDDNATHHASYTVDAIGVSEADMTSISVDDPVINQRAADWVYKGPNTFGTQNRPGACKLGLPPVLVPGQAQPDTDVAGNLTNVSTQPPPVKGSTANPLGIVGSVGEIGLIHSGGQGGALASPQDMPWRSLRLQPRSGAANAMVPDWLLLDLFTAPLQAKNLADESILRPFAEAVGGQININNPLDAQDPTKTQLHPFTTAQISRNAPLASIVQSGTSVLTQTQITSLLTKELAAAPSGNGIPFGTTDLISNKLYLMPGEICEIKGIADSGEESEATVRKVIGLLAAKGNVFSVFSIGQKIIQLPNGKINVLGESRTRTLLERRDETQPDDTVKREMRVLSTSELGL